MKIEEVKELVLKRELSIKNDCKLSCLRKALDIIFNKTKRKTVGHYKYYECNKSIDNCWIGVDSTSLKTVNLSEIIFRTKMELSVLELRKQFKSDEEFKTELAKLINK